MNIYVLNWPEMCGRYDVPTRRVVVAESEEAARRFCRNEYYEPIYEGATFVEYAAWLNPKKVACEEIGVAHPHVGGPAIIAQESKDP